MDFITLDIVNRAILPSVAPIFPFLYSCFCGLSLLALLFSHAQYLKNYL